MQVMSSRSYFVYSASNDAKIGIADDVQSGSAGDDPNYPNLAPDVLYLRHASNLESDEEALHGAETACPLR